MLHQHVGISDVSQAKPEDDPSSVHKAAITVFKIPWIDSVGGSGPPEQFTQVLSDALPQDMTGSLTLLTAAHNKLVKVGSAAVHWLHGDDGRRAVPFREVDGVKPSFQRVDVILPQSFIKRLIDESQQTVDIDLIQRAVPVNGVSVFKEGPRASVAEQLSQQRSC